MAKLNTLQGYGIAITRPPGQALQLADLITQQGGKPILFPLIEIAALADYSEFEHKLSMLEQYDWAVFISSNAVQHAMPRLLQKLGTIPQNLKFAAIGPTTAAELATFGVDHTLVPTTRFDSESLLAAMPQVQQQRIMIFRGVGGRETLAETFQVRGAVVEYAECYRRVNPQHDAGVLAALWQNAQLHALVVTSSEAMRHLLDITDGGKTQWLKNIALCVNHARIADSIRQLNLHVTIADAPGDDHMLQCLTKALTH